MNINQNFIEDVVSSFHAAICARGNLCQVSKSELTVEFYKKHVYQELYALRYVPAYYFEYCVLVDELKKRIGKNFGFLNIKSFGCGLSQDYYALRDNLPDNSFEYIGFDSVKWSSQKYMPPTGNNHKFIFKNVGNLVKEDIDNTDVFIFPKSIGDIKNGGIEIINNISKLISNSKNDRIFFLNSFITRGRNSPLDLAAFKIIHKSLLAAGFKTKDNVDKTFYKHDGITTGKSIGLRAINSGFLYPDKRIGCEELDESDNECRSCPVPMSPIFTNGYMAYQIMEYSRQ
ncbi:MAG: hypothetical protein IV101_08390 [Dechloromonas sp.]|uniref:hypothetical protein n=1 Tax=Dechloromonas sp. TaxID=1917218 RepID=UPI0027EC35A2|nr:hypothetical protein [Dechloromonas sp.]MBT9520903.1 hypothetical protein [Dechloromonas sp.]